MPLQNLFTNAFMHSSIGMALVSPEGRWMRINPALSEMLGYSIEEFMEKTFQDITFPDDLEKDLYALHECLNNKRNTYSIEKRYFHKNGSIVWVNLTVSTVRNEDGEVSFFISQIEDISEHKKDQQKLISSQKMATLGSLAAGISHEVNNPLTVIEGNTAILINEAKKLNLNESTFIKRLETISKTVERISKIVEGMKNYAREDKSNNSENVLFENIIEETLSLCRLKLNKMQIAVGVAIPANSMINCNRIGFTQALLNLIMNSIDALENTGNKRISITGQVDGDKFKVHVSDNGHGIDKSIRTKIMNQFFTTKKYGKGTGLGLSLSKEIILSMGGDLELVENTKNTTFRITIPLAAENKDVAA